jgi:acetyl esterase
MGAFQVRDLVYYRPEGRPLLARLYRPDGPGPFPGLVEVHGGAWVSGDRLNNVAIAEHLAAAGVVVLSLDFRIPPEKGYPDTVADINFGIRWFKQRAEEFGTRADLVGALGTSSGGHLLALNVLRPADPRYAAAPLPGAPGAEVKFAIICWPVADPLTRYRVQQERANERLVAAHHAFWPDVAAMEEGSPQHILSRGEKVVTPPALIMQGDNDDNLTPDMASRFAEAYRQAGGTIDLHMFPGEQHAFIPRDPASANSAQALKLITDFVLRHGS